MSDSLENMADTQNEVTQPVDDVVSEAEATSSPQTDNEETELYVETEGDNEQPNDVLNENAKVQAALIKKDKKRKEERDARIAAENRVAQLEEQISQLSGDVHQIKRGPRPSVYDFETEDEFIAAYETWNNPAPKAPVSEPKKEVNTNADQSLNDAAKYLRDQEVNLSKQLPEYEQNKYELIEKIEQFGGNEQTILYLADMAMVAGVDMAKATVGMNKNQRLLTELNQAAATNDRIKMRDILKEAESKIKVRTPKKIDTQPEPSINSSGPIDNNAAAIKKAQDKYAETGNIQDFRALQAAKKAANL